MECIFMLVFPEDAKSLQPPHRCFLLAAPSESERAIHLCTTRNNPLITPASIQFSSARHGIYASPEHHRTLEAEAYLEGCTSLTLNQLAAGVTNVNISMQARLEAISISQNRLGRFLGTFSCIFHMTNTTLTVFLKFIDRDFLGSLVVKKKRKKTTC